MPLSKHAPSVAWPVYVAEDGSLMLPDSSLHADPHTGLLRERVEALGLAGDVPLLVAGGTGARPTNLVRKRYALALLQVELRILQALGIQSGADLQGRAAEVTELLLDDASAAGRLVLPGR